VILDTELQEVKARIVMEQASAVPAPLIAEIKEFDDRRKRNGRTLGDHVRLDKKNREF
jgi:hypothetical protein